eukprot:m51a1_g418 hypothetical protein (380) ;mRNA; r:10927-12514
MRAESLRAALSSRRYHDVIMTLAPLDRPAIDVTVAEIKRHAQSRDEHEAMFQLGCERGLFCDLCLAWVRGPVTSCVRAMEEAAMMGELTGEQRAQYADALTDAVVLTPCGVAALYERMRSTPDLGLPDAAVTAVAGRKDTPFARLVLQALRSSRATAPDEVEADGKRLLAAAAERRAHEALADVATRRSHAHMRDVDRWLVGQRKSTMFEMARAVTKGPYRKLLLAMLTPRDEYYASLLKKATTKSKGAKKDALLLRVVRANEKPDMLAVAAAYTWMYTEDPERALRRDAKDSLAIDFIVALFEPGGPPKPLRSEGAEAPAGIQRSFFEDAGFFDSDSKFDISSETDLMTTAESSESSDGEPDGRWHAPRKRPSVQKTN